MDYPIIYSCKMIITLIRLCYTDHSVFDKFQSRQLPPNKDKFFGSSRDNSLLSY